LGKFSFLESYKYQRIFLFFRILFCFFEAEFLELDLGAIIKLEHDEYRRFFAKMAKTGPKDGEARMEALAQVMRKIYAHHEAEEVTIFPQMMKISELRGMAFELEVEHADMKGLYDALKGNRADTEVWKYKLATIYDIMHSHWVKEEEQLTPFWMDFFSPSDWAALGKQFGEATERYLNKH
jgi:hemerythrin superfamily protein